ncbi:alpha/beta hydrolase [Rugosimonospora acidiphila]|uniref:Alpha/beta hydrolase n=1 Tax=Rugosimonospora acidiphila TaxID=556531 RepID=A0ABP9S9L3_9ACTN
MNQTHFRTATIDGLDVFYREAGPRDGPAVLLLHGYPTSSHSFRDLIPMLADRYRVIAPDYIGFGYSSMPSVTEFSYTFDALTDVTSKLLKMLDIPEYAVYMHDYGAPVGLRLLLRQPHAVKAIITQSGNAYAEGLVGEFWDPLIAYGKNPGPKTEAAARQGLTLEATRKQYEYGVPDVSVVSPDAWRHAQASIDRPGNDVIQLSLFRDYKTNLDLYPRAQECFRAKKPPLLAVWGRNDPVFGPEGAKAFKRDIPDAEIHLLDTGHFALETHLEPIADHVREFLAQAMS